MVLGPAGTGKTWIAATYAADLLRGRSHRKNYSDSTKRTVRTLARIFSWHLGKQICAVGYTASGRD